MFHAVKASDGATLLARAFDWMKVRTNGGHTLAGFSRADLGLMAGDLGISERDLLALVPRASDNTALMEGMMRARGLDPQAVHDGFLTLLRDIERVCTLCRNTRRCHREQAAGTAADSCHAFCPNAGTLDDLIDYSMGR